MQGFGPQRLDVLIAFARVVSRTSRAVGSWNGFESGSLVLGSMRPESLTKHGFQFKGKGSSNDNSSMDWPVSLIPPPQLAAGLGRSKLKQPPLVSCKGQPREVVQTVVAVL